MFLNHTSYHATLNTQTVSIAHRKDLFGAVSAEISPAILESSAHPTQWGQFSLYACHPIEVLTLHKGFLHDQAGNLLANNDNDIWRVLSHAFSSIEVNNDTGRYGPGWIGYIGYEVGRHIETLPGNTIHDTALPDLRLALYDAVIIHDAQNDSWTLKWWTFEKPPTPQAGLAINVLHDILKTSPSKGPSQSITLPKANSNFTPETYHQAVKKCIDYIAAGDIFQVNLSQRFEVIDNTPPTLIYERLRKKNPATYSAYLNFVGDNETDCAVISSSPELFLRVRNGQVQTRPIKGTRRRTGHSTTNHAAQIELLKSTKDHAELAMIVDLLRNDLGRVCQYGSVRVAEAYRLEAHPTVYHLVATINGKLAPDIGPAELLRATFPGGSITGAPKIRAMQIIDELEPFTRGVYTGCIGWVGANGDCEWNIAIRTIVRSGTRTLIQAGGGIVADSTPEGEYLETLDKARAMLEAVGVPMI